MTHAHMTRRSFLTAAGLGLGAFTMAGCVPIGIGGSDVPRVEMVTNVGGINDQSFCELSWAGLCRLRDEMGYDVAYIESKQDSDYVTNLDKAIDYGSEFVWAIGFAMAEAIEFTAKINPDLNVKFGIVDSSTSGQPNLTGVLFAAEEPSFAVGYAAGRTTKTDHVGFVGGIASDNIYAFEYGYLAGVTYAAHELGKAITVDRQYAESFTDSAKGKSIAQKMIAGGADVVFHAAGSTGIGVIEAAQEHGKFAIGVDMDQSHLAPNNVLTSAIKRVDQAMFDLTPKLLSGEVEGGSDIVLRLKDGDYVGIAEEHSLMPEGVYEATLAVMENIRNGQIQAPATKDACDAFISSLG